MWKDIETRFREKLQNDDHEAVVFLHQMAYREMLHAGLRICLNKDLVRDVIHDVFVNLWTNRQSLCRIDNLRSYLLASLKNTLLRRLSRETRYCRIDETADDHLFSEGSAENALMMAEQDEMLRGRIAASMKKLTPRQREVIRMRYYDELSISRISHITGMETKTVYNTIYNAMKVLGAELAVSLQD